MLPLIEGLWIDIYPFQKKKFGLALFMILIGQKGVSMQEDKKFYVYGMDFIMNPTELCMMWMP